MKFFLLAIHIGNSQEDKRTGLVHHAPVDGEHHKINDIVSMRSRVRLDRANFSPEEYENLRSFFTLVVGKQNEQIVFKKKK